MNEQDKVELKLIHMEDVISKEVSWLWYPYIPYGKITVIECVWQVGIQPARQRKSNHFGSEIQPPYCSAIALSNVANGNSAHHA